MAYLEPILRIATKYGQVCRTIWTIYPLRNLFGAKTAVPATLNDGALDLMHAERSRLDGARRKMALRLMRVYEALDCTPTWKCRLTKRSTDLRPVPTSPGAKLTRLPSTQCSTGRAPCTALHLAENRRARLVVDCSKLSARLKRKRPVAAVQGALLTNSGKFAFYAPGNTTWSVLYASLA
jgi:predicted aconitase